MKSIHYFRAGAVSYIVFGTMHLLIQFCDHNLGADIVKTFEMMKVTPYVFLEPTNLMHLYEGFSITMGVMLIAFGLQALLVRRPRAGLVIMCILLSGIVLFLSIFYFTPMAYVLIGLSLICFLLSFFTRVYIK